MVSSYPVQFDVDFPSRPLDRLTTAFRLLVAIPIVIVLTMLTGETLRDHDDTTNKIVIGGAAVFLPLVLMLVFRQKYPRWWFDWNLNLLRFSNRVTAYLARSTIAIRRRTRSRQSILTSRIPTPAS